MIELQFKSFNHIVTCRGLDYLSCYTRDRACVVAVLRELSALQNNYTDMRYVFTMVYLTVGYLSALQYIQCKTTMVCLTVDGSRPREASLTHS